MTATINYLEFPATDLTKIKAFYTQVFQWEFTDYGPEYTAFNCNELDGGFYQSPQCNTTATGGVLVVFYHADLIQVQQQVIDAGGKIVKAIFDFPGGQRFHFNDPCGNELAVWSDNPVS